MKRFKDRITPSLLISSLALFVALGGASYAALGKNSVGSKQLKKNAVVTKKIKKNAVTSSKIKKNAIVTSKIKNNNVTGAKVKESSLGVVPEATRAVEADNSTTSNSASSAAKLDGYRTYKQTRFTATTGVDFDAALAAAPEQQMFTAGPITVYAKCFTNLSGPETYGYVLAKTSENGVIYDSDDGSFDGDPDFLDTTTLEVDRGISYADASTNSADINLDFHYTAVFMTPSGSSFAVNTGIASKNGTLAGGNGLYGSGDSCLFSGELSEFNG